MAITSRKRRRMRNRRATSPPPPTTQTTIKQIGLGKRIKESFKKRVVARFLSLLEINLVDLRVYDEDVFTVTTTQMVLTTKPVADAEGVREYAKRHSNSSEIGSRR